MDLQKTISQSKEIIDSINEKYKTVMDEIKELDEKLTYFQNLLMEIQSAPEKVQSMSKQYIEDQKAKLMKKINDKTAAIDQWVSEQQKKITDWASGKKTQIQSELEDKVKQGSNSLSNFNK